jgi:hypothetical protein
MDFIKEFLFNSSGSCLLFRIGAAGVSLVILPGFVGVRAI